VRKPGGTHALTCAVTGEFHPCTGLVEQFREGDRVTGFVQIIEWKTSKIEDVEKLNDEWRERFPDMGPTRVLVGADRDNEGTYVTVVEFESYEAAMKNSADPATTEFAERMAELCDGPPTFRDLDVKRTEERQ
jgi:hypothetical protein